MRIRSLLLLRTTSFPEKKLRLYGRARFGGANSGVLSTLGFEISTLRCFRIRVMTSRRGDHAQEDGFYRNNVMGFIVNESSSQGQYDNIYFNFYSCVRTRDEIKVLHSLMNGF